MHYQAAVVADSALLAPSAMYGLQRGKRPSTVRRGKAQSAETVQARPLVFVNLPHSLLLSRIRQAFATERSLFRCFRLERRHSLRRCNACAGATRERRVAAGTSAQRAPPDGQSARLGGRTHAVLACGAPACKRREQSTPGASRVPCDAVLRAPRAAARERALASSFFLARNARSSAAQEEARRRVSALCKPRLRPSCAAHAFVVVLLGLLGGLQRLRLAAILANHG